MSKAITVGLHRSTKLMGRLLELTADYHPKAADAGPRRAPVDFINYQK